MTIPCYPAQLHTALQYPPATLPTACRKANSPLSEVTGERKRQNTTHSTPAWQQEQIQPFFVPEIIQGSASWIATATCQASQFSSLQEERPVYTTEP